jgi:hypothetical protein
LESWRSYVGDGNIDECTGAAFKESIDCSMGTSYMGVGGSDEMGRMGMYFKNALTSWEDRAGGVEEDGFDCDG